MGQMGLFIVLLCSLASAGTDLSSGSLGGYFTYSEISGILDAYIFTYPNLTSKSKLADSTLLNEVDYLKVASGTGLPTSEKKSLIISGGLYGGSPISASAVIYAIDRLFEHSELLEKIDVYFVPVVNLDAYLEMQEEFEASGTFTAVYKNSKDHTCPGDNSKSGVNLDRNFDANWGASAEGSSDDGCSEFYRGLTQLSENESSGLDGLMQSAGPTILIHFEGNEDIIYLPKKSARIAPDEFIESLNGTPKGLFYKSLTEYEKLNAQTLYSKKSTVADGSLIESAFLRDTLALEIGLGLGTERGTEITKLVTKTKELLTNMYFDGNYELLLGVEVYENDCGQYYNCTEPDGFSYFLYELTVENKSPIASPALTLNYYFWKETSQIEFNFTLKQVYLQTYEYGNEHDHSSVENFGTELPFTVKTSELGINATVALTAKGSTGNVIIFLIEKSVAVNETGELKTWFTADLYPTSLATNPGNLKEEFAQVEIDVAEIVKVHGRKKFYEDRVVLAVGAAIAVVLFIAIGCVLFCCVFKGKPDSEFKGSVAMGSGQGPAAQPRVEPGNEPRV